MGLGHDDSVVYVRAQKELEDKGCRSPQQRQFESIHVGFCGKIYHAFVVYDFAAEKPTRAVCYDIEDLDRFVYSHFDKDDIAFYEGEKVRRVRPRYFDIYSTIHGTRKSLVHYWERIKTENWTWPHYTKLFAEHNTPIFVVDGVQNKIFINCLLRPYEFYKVVDAYTAYQEVSMYVGGVLLAPVNPIPDIPDDTMRDIKGFDKWSFRKEPNK